MFTASVLAARAFGWTDAAADDGAEANLAQLRADSAIYADVYHCDSDDVTIHRRICKPWRILR